MKTILAALTISVFSVSAAYACTNMKRLPVFNYNKHASGDADFTGTDPKSGRDIVIRHSSGISRVKIRAKRGAAGLYIRSGTGAPLPVTVTVSENLCKTGATRLFTRKFHARLPHEFSTRFYTPFKSSQNRSQAIALAQTILRNTYCPKGDIKLNPDFRYVDETGAQPTVRVSPVAQPWGSDPFDETWIVQLTCSEWRKPE